MNQGYLYNSIRKVSCNGLMAGFFFCGLLGLGLWFFVYKLIAPEVLDASFFSYLNSPIRIIFFAFGVIAFILSFVFVLKNLITLLNPRVHSAFRGLVYSSRDIAQDLGRLDAEMSDSQTVTLKNFTVSRSFLLYHPRFAGFIPLSLHINRISSILWAYVDQISEYYGPMPSGTTYKLHLFEKDFQDLYQTDNAEEVLKVLDSMREFNPYSFYKYSPEAEDLYHNNRDKMIQLIAQRRREGDSVQPEPSPDVHSLTVSKQSVRMRSDIPTPFSDKP